MENRFKRLRYEDDLCLHKKYTMDELAAKMPISKATISHLEASDDYDARISVIKEYKKLFPDVSYDYLLGGKNTMHKEYSHIEEVLPFNNDFYTNLEQLFKTESDSFISITKTLFYFYFSFEAAMSKFSLAQPMREVM